MRQRAAWLIDEQQIALPSLLAPLPRKSNSAWFPIPGMYGGSVTTRWGGDEASDPAYSRLLQVILDNAYKWL